MSTKSPLPRWLLAAATLAPLATHLPTARAAGEHTLVGYLGMCLADGGGTSHRAVMTECTGDNFQSWEYLPDTLQLRRRGTSLCLYAAGGATAAGTPLILWPCSAVPWPNEQWQRERVNGDVRDDLRIQLRGVGSGRCVEVPSQTHAPGTQLVLSDCAGSPQDLWFSAWGAVLDVPVHVYAATNDDGTNSGLVPADMSATIADANLVMARAGLRYVWDNQITYRRAERLNAELLGAGAVERDVELRRIASEDVHRMPIVLENWGSGWSAMTQRSPGGLSWNDYVAMPSAKNVRIYAGRTWEQDLTGWMLLHEGGHYLGLDHTAPSPGHVDHPEQWDADGLVDTPPDPSIDAFRAVWSLLHAGQDPTKHECDSASGTEPDGLSFTGTLRAIPEKGNAMSYYDCVRPVRYTPLQISKMRSSLWNYASRMTLFAPVTDRAPVVDVATTVTPSGYRLYTARGDGVLEVRASSTGDWAAAAPTVIGNFGQPIRVGAVTHGGRESVLVTALDSGAMWVGWPSGAGYAWQDWTPGLPEPMREAVGTTSTTGQVFALGASGAVYLRYKLTSATSANWSGWIPLPPATLESIAVGNQDGTTTLLGLTRSGGWSRLVRWSPGAPGWTSVGKTPWSPAVANPYALTVAIRTDHVPQVVLAGSGDDSFLPLGMGALFTTALVNDKTAVSDRIPTRLASERHAFGALDLASIRFADNSMQVIYAYPVEGLRIVTVANGKMSAPATLP